MDNLPISVALLNKLRYLLNIPLCSEEQGAQNQNNGDDAQNSQKRPAFY